MLRGAFLALLLVAPLLAGCITLTPPAADLTPPVAEGRLVLAGAPPATGVLGLWVPAGTTALTITWGTGNTSAATTDEDKAQVHEEMRSSLLRYFDDLLVLVGPDGERLFVGTPTFRHPLPDSSGADVATSRITLPQGVLFSRNDPTPGLYRLVHFGTVATPRIHLEVPLDIPVPPLAPLPLTLTRTTLLSGPTPLGTLLEAEGAWTPPNGTVAVWPALSGTGGDASLTFTTDRGDVAASIHHDVLLDPRAAGFGFDLVGVGGANDPTLLDGRALQWRARGVGLGNAYALAAVVAPLAAPLLDTRDTPSAALETTPMEGQIEPWQAVAVRLPADARLVLRLAEDDRDPYDHASYRIYDALGTRLAWGSTDGATAPLPLPTGPLAIVNDGPGTLEVDILGTPPSDATLHELGTDSTTTSVRLEAAGGGESAVRVVLNGPGRSIMYDHNSDLTDIWLQVERPDGAPVAVAPEPMPHPYQSGGQCCMVPFFGYGVADPHAVDTGIHHLRLRAESGRGEVRFDIVTYDLGDLLDLVPDDN